MPKSTASTLDLDVDLQSGVVPISKAASALAALIKRGKERQQPIIVTQKGYPTGVLLPIDLYSTLRDLAQREVGAITDLGDGVPVSVTLASDDLAGVGQIVAALPDLAEVTTLEEAADEATVEAAPAQRRGRGGRKAKAAE
ncbi:MAG: type II toxin-antitoxin system prevent-host-death family antitoxin [Chloroflexales bacterium]|nr:type II toxin-antitoxin system prevent-host-death family antitoxin [Chloroflexales bacterium]